MSEYEYSINANSYIYTNLHYRTRFKNLLLEIYLCYEQMIKNNIFVPNNENKIRDILVDDYLSININDYEFKKEEKNNLGRVDIYIIDNLTDAKPHFIIECKLLDNKNINGKDGLNGKYITNGVLRFLTEHYCLENNFNTNAMIGFVVKKLDISSNIESINELTEKIFKNIVEIKQPIILEKECIYQSFYQTGKPEKDFLVYHLMMDFSDSLQ